MSTLTLARVGAPEPDAADAAPLPQWREVYELRPEPSTLHEFDGAPSSTFYWTQRELNMNDWAVRAEAEIEKLKSEAERLKLEIARCDRRNAFLSVDTLAWSEFRGFWGWGETLQELAAPLYEELFLNDDGTFEPCVYNPVNFVTEPNALLNICVFENVETVNGYPRRIRVELTSLIVVWKVRDGEFRAKVFSADEAFSEVAPNVLIRDHVDRSAYIDEIFRVEKTLFLFWQHAFFKLACRHPWILGDLPRPVDGDDDVHVVTDLVDQMVEDEQVPGMVWNAPLGN